MSVYYIHCFTAIETAAVYTEQLRIEMDNGRVFSGFKEAPITFRPSYRYNRNEVDAKGYRTFSPEVGLSQRLFHAFRSVAVVASISSNSDCM